MPLFLSQIAMDSKFQPWPIWLFFKLNITNYKHNQVWNKSPEKFSYQEFHFLLSDIFDKRKWNSW